MHIRIAIVDSIIAIRNLIGLNMIGKNEEEDTNDNNLYRIKLIANKRKSLEDNTAQVSNV